MKLRVFTGVFMKINTDPMRYQEAYVEVVGKYEFSYFFPFEKLTGILFFSNVLFVCLVPPDIIDGESSTDTVVREGSNVSLTCAASGHPQPHILWRREDGASIARGKLKG